MGQCYEVIEKVKSLSFYFVSICFLTEWKSIRLEGREQILSWKNWTLKKKKNKEEENTQNELWYKTKDGVLT